MAFDSGNQWANGGVVLRFTSLKSLFPLSYRIPFPSYLVSSSDASIASSSFPPHVSHMSYTCFPMHSSHHHILTPCFIHAPFISFYLSHVHFIYISSYHITYMQLPHGL